MEIEWIESENQLADVLTKGLNKQTYNRLIQNIMKKTDETKGKKNSMREVHWKEEC